MSYTKMSIKIEALLVSPENPRFNSVTDQQEAFEIMLEKMKQKIKNLACDIANNGLNPTKSLCVFKHKQGKYIVLEGNRRLIAIKLIKNPNIIKHDDNLYTFFQKLKLKRNGYNFPKELNCIVFENKEDANHWIELEHTGDNKGVGQVPWDPEQKARFKSQVSNSNKRPYFQVLDFMKEKNITLRQGHATNIERLVNTSYVKKEVGVDFQNGKLTFVKNKEIVSNNLKKIAKAINKPDFKVKEIYTAKDREKWIDKTLADERQPKTTITKRDGQIIKKTKQRLILIPEDFIINIPQQRINLI